jgi:four helix bundle protein
MSEKIEFAQVLADRTKWLAIRVIKIVGTFPNNVEYWIIGKQLIRSATSVAANYRAVRRSRSNKEFLAKLNIVVEECDETLFWMEMLEDAELIDASSIEDIKKETIEVLKVLATSKQTMTNKLRETK